MRFTFSIILSLALIIISVVPCFATETGYYLENINESTQECDKIIQNLELKLIDFEVTDRSITRFNVSKDGLIAIGFQSMGTDYICVYTNTGDFLYGYSFELDSSFGIEWEDNNVAIYLVRSNILITLDENGKCIKTADIASVSGNDEYSRKLLTQTQKEVGGKTYIIKNQKGFLGLFSSTYAMLVSLDDMGNETIIYDSGIVGWIEPVGNIVILAVALIAAFGIYIKHRKHTARNKD